MDEFNNRMDAQRTILAIVNRYSQSKEELCGLSRKAIERWISANRLDPQGELAVILLHISSKLFFLAAKSQEQVTDDYRALATEIESLARGLRIALEGAKLGPALETGSR